MPEDYFSTRNAKVGPGRAAVLRARWYARRTVTRLDNPAVKDARRLVKRLRSDPPDVLYLGDSQSTWVNPDDGDERSVVEIMSDELGADVAIHTVAYAGYHNKLHEAYLRFVDGVEARPLVLVDVGLRPMFQSWLQHPVYGHREARAWLEALDPSARWWRIRAGFPRPGPEAWKEFYGIRHATIVGDLTVGDYVKPLKSGSLSRDERQRLIYAYYHGAEVHPDDASVQNCADLGRKLRELGCRAVAYNGPMPVERCTEIFGPQIVDQIERSYEVMNDAYREGFGAEATILRTGTSFTTGEFLDDASEHLNGRGRQRFGRILAEAVRAELERDYGTTTSGSNGASRAPASSARRATTSQTA